ncbi:hypothetical protein ACPOL_5973 [Acidisarcina polymorpha]|uniref:Uncharacterized protein n=1 Tax=Acidisarcina polymorpha TaxID=2211140 RepID=A0A2Z5G8U8_9BACT|nr:hypothetical protein ACPOL_5973 [Acidisarcina polymorpha]
METASSLEAVGISAGRGAGFRDFLRLSPAQENRVSRRTLPAPDPTDVFAPLSSVNTLVFWMVSFAPAE